jgi:hypothetical protein
MGGQKQAAGAQKAVRKNNSSLIEIAAHAQRMFAHLII